MTRCIHHRAACRQHLRKPSCSVEAVAHQPWHRLRAALWLAPSYAITTAVRGVQLVTAAVFCLLAAIEFLVACLCQLCWVALSVVLVMPRIQHQQVEDATMHQEVSLCIIRVWYESLPKWYMCSCRWSYVPWHSLTAASRPLLHSAFRVHQHSSRGLLPLVTLVDLSLVLACNLHSCALCCKHTQPLLIMLLCRFWWVLLSMFSDASRSQKVSLLLSREPSCTSIDCS